MEKKNCKKSELLKKIKSLTKEDGGVRITTEEIKRRPGKEI